LSTPEKQHSITEISVKGLAKKGTLELASGHWGVELLMPLADSYHTNIHFSKYSPIIFSETPDIEQ
jgi:hypothetical protein